MVLAATGLTVSCGELEPCDDEVEECEDFDNDKKKKKKKKR